MDVGLIGYRQTRAGFISSAHCVGGDRDSWAHTAGNIEVPPVPLGEREERGRKLAGVMSWVGYTYYRDVQGHTGGGM